MADGIVVEPLTEARARQWATMLLSMNADQIEDYWTADHLLAYRPEKWQRSKIALAGNTPVGYVIASRTSESVHVHHLIVAAPQRGHGVGRRLLTAVLTEAPGPVTAKALPGNAASLNLFRALGFAAVGTTEAGYVQLRRTGPRGLRVAAHQPNYLPWCGFFAKMQAADVFILDDTVGFSRRSYTSRVRIAKDRTHHRWLSIPVRHHRLNVPISEVEFADHRWPRQHLNVLHTAYHRAPFAADVLAEVAAEYADPGGKLADFNIRLIRRLADHIGWPGTFVLARELDIPFGLPADERITHLVHAVGGSTYLSGAGGQNYQRPDTFTRAGLDLQVLPYQPTPYDRQGGAWMPGLSVLDALMYLGPQAWSVLAYRS